jgi:hypothetical protein
MTSMTSATTCSGYSVGVVVTRIVGGRLQILLGDRADHTGAAPITAHTGDPYVPFTTTARDAVAATTGLTVHHLHLVVNGDRRPDRCPRGDSPRGRGHSWRVYTADASGTLDTDLAPDYTTYTRVYWADRDQVRELAARTGRYADGWIGARRWRLEPGIEPVWVRFLHTLTVVCAPASVLDAVDGIVASGPRVWTHDPAPGGLVCGVPDPDGPDRVCGHPVETEPCTVHYPHAGE